MARAPRSKRAPRANGDPHAAAGDVPAATTPAIEAIDDTSVSEGNGERYGDDETSPIDRRVRLRQCCGYKLERVRVDAAGNETFDKLYGPGLHEGVSYDEVGAQCGPGVYILTWYKRAKTAGLPLGRVVYHASRFTLAPATAASPAPAAPAPGAVVVAPPGGAYLPAPSTFGRDERLIPTAIRLDEQWFMLWQAQAQDDRRELVSIINNQNSTLAAMANQAAAQTAQIVAMSGNLVQAMHAQSTREIDARMALAGHIAELERAGGGSMMERTLAPIVQRMVNKFLPDTTATPDKLEQMVDKVDRVMPKLEQMADAVPQMQAGMRKVEGFADRASALMGGGAEEAPLQRTPDGPLDGAGQPAIEVPTEPEVLDA